MFSREYKIEALYRDKETNFWTAEISYYAGIFGLFKKYSKLSFIQGVWVDMVSMKNIYKYHPLIEVLNNCLHIELKKEANNVQK